VLNVDDVITNVEAPILTKLNIPPLPLDAVPVKTLNVVEVIDASYPAM
jgi:hypothetical protein